MSDRVAREPELERCPEAPEDVPRRPRPRDRARRAWWPRLTRAKDPGIGRTARAMAARFLTRAQVAEELNISMAHCYALLRRGELRAAKIGARGDYRIGRDDLEAYIERNYAEMERWLREHPIVDEDSAD